jgi:hypothetical protein
MILGCVVIDFADNEGIGINPKAKEIMISAMAEE